MSSEFAAIMLLESSQRLLQELKNHPFWDMFNSEPVIVQWMAAIQQMESECKKSAN